MVRESTEISQPERFEERHLVAERWVVGLTEPLLPVDAKIETEQRMIDLLGKRDSVWTTAFLSLFLFGIVASLPEDDPWRHVRFFIPGGPQWAPKALTEGAWVGAGAQFGTADDVTDILIPSQTDAPEVDFITVGSLMLVPGWFTARAGALIGAAGLSWRATFHAICAQRGLRGSRDVFDDIVRATSSALHRRRTYMGMTDYSMPVHLFTSLAFADRVAKQIMPADIDPHLVADVIAHVDVFDEYSFGGDLVPPGSYQLMKVDFSEFDAQE